MVREEVKPRCTRKICRIDKLHVQKDGVIRGVKI